MNTVNTSIQWLDCAQNVPVYVQQMYNVTTWEGPDLPPLPDTLACGRLNVPLDYSKPISVNNTISIGFAMNRPAGAKELFNYNPGGPGIEVTPFAWLIALKDPLVPTYFEGLLDQDYLAADTRGFWQSTPLNCSNEAALAIPLALPFTESEFEAYKAATANFAESCVAQSTPPGLVHYVGTEENAKDWDLLRAALGYKKMNFIGVSFGSYFGEEYVKQFPEHVGNFVFDAVSAHGLSLEQLVIGQINATNRLVLRADAYCLYDESCPFHSEGKGAVPAALAKVIALAENGTLPNVTATEVKVALYSYLGGAPTFPTFNLALSQALAGNATLLVPDAATILIGSAASLPVLCLDEDIRNDTWATFQDLAAKVAKIDTTGFNYSEIWQLKIMCAGWPFLGRSPKPVVIKKPVLYVTADYDLNTPTEWATFQWKLSPTSTLVDRHGDFHVTLYVTGSPAQQMEVDYARTGVFPAPTEERLVGVYPPGSERPPIPDPYTAPIGPEAGDF